MEPVEYLEKNLFWGKLTMIFIEQIMITLFMVDSLLELK